jgi:hypothetical protein
VVVVEDGLNGETVPVTGTGKRVEVRLSTNWAEPHVQNDGALAVTSTFQKPGQTQILDFSTVKSGYVTFCAYNISHGFTSDPGWPCVFKPATDVWTVTIHVL